MSELNVRIVKLGPLRVASVLGYGKEPEDIAWKKLAAFAQAHGLFENLDQHRVFASGYLAAFPAIFNASHAFENGGE